MHGFLTWLNTQTGTFIGIAATALISWLIYLRQKTRKHIDYRYITSTRVFKPRSEKVYGEIKVMVDGREVEDARFVTIRYINTGNQMIERNDFLKYIGLSEATGIVSVKMVDKSDDTLQMIEAGVMPNIQWGVETMNARDHFDVQYVLDESKGHNRVLPECKIKNETRSMRNQSKRLRRISVMIGLSGIAIGVGGAYIIASILHQPVDIWVPVMVASLFTATVCASTLLASSLENDYGRPRSSAGIGHRVP